jgi:hypothetical protein
MCLSGRGLVMAVMCLYGRGWWLAVICLSSRGLLVCSHVPFR